MRASHQSACAFANRLRVARLHLALPFIAVEPGLEVARDLPLFQGVRRRRVERVAQRLQLALPLFLDHVDLGVVGDRLQRYVRGALVDEALTDIAVSVTSRLNAPVMSCPFARPSALSASK